MSINVAAKITLISNAITNMAINIKNYIDQRAGERYVDEYITILTGASKEYDLDTLVGTPANYNKKATKVTLLKETQDAPEMIYTLDTTIKYSIVDERYVRIINDSGSDLKLYVSIEVPGI